MSDLSNDTKNHTTKSRETIPLKLNEFVCKIFEEHPAFTCKTLYDVLNLDVNAQLRTS
jgi:hypothetical protein